jgi:hypothetical protein
LPTDTSDDDLDIRFDLEIDATRADLPPVAATPVPPPALLTQPPRRTPPPAPQPRRGVVTTGEATGDVTIESHPAATSAEDVAATLDAALDALASEPPPPEPPVADRTEREERGEKKSFFSKLFKK